MYIKQLMIYGFGQWIDQSFTLNESLTCFYGKNESGKSTLQNFILFMLFGLPPKQRKSYRPKTSGQFGGRLTIVDPNLGEYTVERLEGQKNAQATCYLPNGVIKDEKWLTEQLNGFTYEMYQSVYSFSALDLNDFESMNAKEIGDVILSIGLTGSQHIYELERKLAQQLGHLFKPYGKKPLMNEQITHLTTLQKQLIDQEKNLVTYENNHIQSDTIKKEIAKLIQQRDERKNELTHLNQLLQSITLVQDYEYNRAQLRKLPRQLTFPEKGVQRYEALKEKLLPLQSELTFIQSQMREAKQTIKKLQQQLMPENLFERAKKVVQKQSAYEEREQLIAKETKTIESELIHLTQQLVTLTRELTLEDLNKLNFPFQTQSYWQSLNNEHEQIILTKEHYAQQKQEINQREKTLNDRLQTIEQDMLTEAERQTYIEQINERANEPLPADQIISIKKQVADDRQKNRFIFISSIILAVTMFLSSYFFAQSYLTIGSLFILMFGFIYFFMSQRSMQTIEQFVSDQEKLKPSAHINGTHELMSRLERDDALKYEHKALQADLQKVTIDRLQWEEKQRSIEQREKRLNDQLSAVRQQYPFLKNVSLTYWTNIYHQLDQLQESYVNVQEKITQNEQLEKQQQIFAQDVLEIVKEIDLQQDEQQTAQQIQTVAKFIDEQSSIKQQLAYEKATLAEQNMRKNHLNVQIESLYKEINELFKRADVQTEEEFYEKATQMEAKKNYEFETQKLHEQLSLMFQTDNWQPLIDRPLEEKLLIAEKEKVTEALNELKQMLDEKRQLSANLQANIAHLEQSDDYSTLVHQLQMEKAELNRLAKQWAVIKTAEQMLQRTKRTYEQKHLTNVLKQTSHYFKKITNGAYTDVFLRAADETLTVEANNQLQFDLTELSKGTIDQLYIALRLAMSKIIGNKHKFPFIIDDAFIHSDEERVANIVEVLQDISKDQQLILFTCKQQIAAHFTKLQLQTLHTEIPSI
ncbi:MAG TPA: AAA family ATPase [Bacillota bacterium]|nr:AAA family ATPase [Bacillota bacterium]